MNKERREFNKNKHRGFNIKHNSVDEIPKKCENCTAHEETFKNDMIIDICAMPYLEAKDAKGANDTCSIKVLNNLIMSAKITDPQLRSDIISKDIVNMQKSGLNPDVLIAKINHEVKLQTGYDSLHMHNEDVLNKIIDYIREAIGQGIGKKELMNSIPKLVTAQCNY